VSKVEVFKRDKLYAVIKPWESKQVKYRLHKTQIYSLRIGEVLRFKHKSLGLPTFQAKDGRLVFFKNKRQAFSVMGKYVKEASPEDKGE
jgi:hypothetical protein